MRTRKSFIVIGGMLLALIIAVMPFASACAPGPSGEEAAEAEYKWRFASPWAQKTRNESIQMFCDLIGVYSDGRVEVEFYPDGLLGSHSEIFHAVREGDVEIGVYAPYVDIVPGGMLNWMPWTVGTFEEAAIAYASPDGILFEVMTEAWAEVGHKLLWNSPFGPYGIGNTVRPLKTPDDFENWKFRVSASLGFVKCMENMSEGSGMTLETIPWADLYNALERGVVDANWSLWPSLIEERHYEVLKYYTDLGFGWDSANICMNAELWEGLPADIQDVIFAAGKMAEERDYEAERRVSQLYKKELVESGLEIYYPTPAERDVFRQKARMGDVWQELCKPWLDEHYPGQNMTQKIQDELARIAKECAGA